MMNTDLEYAVSLAMYRSAGEGVSWAAYEAVYQAVFQAVYGAVNVAVQVAVSRRLRRPTDHGLALYLGVVA